MRNKPQITQIKDGKLSVKVFDGLIQKEISIPIDLLVLSMPVRPQPDAQTLATTLKVPLNTEGFFLEAHLKLRPLDFANEGMFLCGLAHSPKMIDENISQAHAAAARAATVLSKTQLEVNAQVSKVDQEKCISCMTCVRSCPYSAPFANTDGKAEITAANCMGCGICVSECPARAIQLAHFESKQFNAMIDELFQVLPEENPEPAVEPVKSGVRV